MRGGRKTPKTRKGAPPFSGSFSHVTVLSRRLPICIRSNFRAVWFDVFFCAARWWTSRSSSLRTSRRLTRPRPGREALDDLRSFADGEAAVLPITHDIELALRVADRVAVFKDGTVVEETAVANFASPICFVILFHQGALARVARSRFRYPGRRWVMPEALDIRSAHPGGRPLYDGFSLSVDGAGERVALFFAERYGKTTLCRTFPAIFARSRAGCS